MRIVTTFDKENLARRFSMFLQKQDIENSIDVDMDTETKKFTYEIWVYEEDKLSLAKSYLEDFLKNPKDPKFDVSLKELYPDEEKDSVNPQLPPVKNKAYSYKITAFTLLVCIFVFIINIYQELDIRKDNPKITYVLLTPIQELLLFDVPYVLIKANEVIKKYQIDPTKDIFKQSPLAEEEIKKIDQMPYFRGFYDVIISKVEKEKKEVKISGPYFEKIRQGQVWRLFSPCILHKELLHLLFNMLWLWMLGKQIEQRLSKIKYILLMLIVGVISNVSQYLMSGPYFLGYSGVIMGMVGFIWARQQVAPWEGYPLQKAVLLFLAVYVLLMFVLSFFSFVTQAIGFNLLAPNIANTAHIAGAVVGYLLGRLPFFSWSVHHEH